MDHFCSLFLLFVMLSCLFVAALCHLLGKGLTYWLSCMLCLNVFCHFPMWCPGQVRCLVVLIPDLCILSHFAGNGVTDS